MIEIKKLYKSYGNNEVLRGIDQTVSESEVLCIVGPSGSGKSTMLRCINLLEVPTSGEVFIDGELVTNQNINETRTKMGMVFQYSALFDSMTVGENVAFGLREHKKLKESRIASIVREKLHLVGLDGSEHRMPDELSGGMRQRVASLRTALIGSDIMLLDEPFSALDALTRREMRAWLMSSVKEFGFSALVITHDVAVAMASRIYVMAGSPAQGVVTKIVGFVEPQNCVETVDTDSSQDADLASFDLSDKFLAAKREVLLLLG